MDEDILASMNDTLNSLIVSVDHLHESIHQLNSSHTEIKDLAVHYWGIITPMLDKLSNSPIMRMLGVKE